MREYVSEVAINTWLIVDPIITLTDRNKIKRARAKRKRIDSAAAGDNENVANEQ